MQGLGITADFETGAAHYTIPQSAIKRTDNSALLACEGMVFCSSAGTRPVVFAFQGEVISAAEMPFTKTNELNALVAAWKIGEACKKNTSGVRVLVSEPWGNTPFYWFNQALQSINTPLLHRKLQVLVFRDETDGNKRAILGVSGQRFRQIGPGPDTPIDDSVRAYAFAIVDYELLPEELKESLGGSGDPVVKQP